MTAFQERLQKKRKEKGFTQAKLAELANVSKATINKYETKSDTAPTADILLAISKALDVSVDWLLGNDEYCVKSVSEAEKITSGDIKRAFEMLFTAFGSTLKVETFADSDLHYIYFTDPITDKYIAAYKQFEILFENGVQFDEKTRRAVLDAIFPQNAFLPAGNGFGGSFIPPEDEDDDLPFDV